ncbi:unnamed protein product, partial [marine sediment metagenome]
MISYSIFATGEITADESIEDKLSSILNLDKETIAGKLNLDKSFVWLKRKVSPEVSKKIKGLDISGIGRVKECKRFYPNGPLACHVIGFTDI